MKESNNKTSGRSQASASKSGVKSGVSSSRSSLSNRGTACSSSASRPRGNNPEGINQYTKKSGGSK